MRVRFLGSAPQWGDGGEFRRLGELATRYGRRTARDRAAAWRRGVGATTPG